MKRNRFRPEIKKNQSFALNITSMTDMFTIMLVFLLQSFASGEVQILMHVDAYSDGRSLQTEIDEKSFLLIPIGLVEKGADYDLAKFRLVEQEGSHHDESY